MVFNAIIDCMSRNRNEIANIISNKAFNKTRFTESYVVDSVNAYMNELVIMLHDVNISNDDIMNSIEHETFETTRFRTGYSISDVDDFLDEIRRMLE